MSNSENFQNIINSCNENSKILKICVLQVDYKHCSNDFKNFDPPLDLSQLMPEASIDHVFLDKLSTYKQLKDLKPRNYDIYVNLCQGYLHWEVPSIDVIQSLELLNLPYTGPNVQFYNMSKTTMKYVAFCVGVKSPNYIEVESAENVHQVQGLNFPLFVKPSNAGDSLGIFQDSLVHNLAQLNAKVDTLLLQYQQVLIQEYIQGREFTVLVCNNPDGNTVVSFKPVQYIFPKGHTFKDYALKTSEMHPKANIPVNDKLLSLQLQESAKKIFSSCQGVGYSRMDFRMNSKGEIYFLEANFLCSVFYQQDYAGSADWILKYDQNYDHKKFLDLIIREGIARFKRNQKLYVRKWNPISGYGIFAKYDLPWGTVFSRGQQMCHRLVSKDHVEECWDQKQKQGFWRDCYPLEKDYKIKWAADPNNWDPINHSCYPNCTFKGLDGITLKPIKKGEQLKIDYTTCSYFQHFKRVLTDRTDPKIQNGIQIQV